MKILFKYPTRYRPELFKRGIESIINNVSEDYHILVSVDADDAKIAEYSYIYPNTTFEVGLSKNKVDAVNRKVNDFYYEWDILVVMSDDMVFIEKGFDRIIRESFIEIGGEDSGGNIYGETDLNQFVHFPDGNRSDLCTMSIIGRYYYNRDKYIYNPEYITECCDDEAQEVAKLRGCYKFVDKQIFEHKHVAYGKASWDESYMSNLTVEKQTKDRETLQRRKEINFGL